MIRKLALLIVALLLACDPGWSYKVLGGKEDPGHPGHWSVPGPSQTTLGAYAQLSISRLGTVLAIENHGTTPLVVRPAGLHLADHAGHELAIAEWDHQKPVSCAGHPGEAEVGLAAGQACVMDVTFTVQPDAKKLKTLRMTHDGVTREGVPVPVMLQLEIGNH
jgi:hypothetical protein